MTLRKILVALTLSLCTIVLLPFGLLHAQQIDTVQTITYDSLGRAGVYQFPPNDTTQYEKVILQYRIRCHHALVSDGNHTEQGCGQWDYNCETYITDSSRTDSVKALQASAIVSNYPGGKNFPFTTIPTYTILRRPNSDANHVFANRYDVGSSRDSSPAPFGVRTPHAERSVMIVQASELSSAGLKKGKIAALLLRYLNASPAMARSTIRLRLTSLIAPDPSDLRGSGWKTVVQSAQRDSIFTFLSNFVWDGTSNIELDFATDATAAPPVAASRTLAQSVLTSSTTDSALQFSGYEGIQIAPDHFNLLTNEITICCWTLGDSLVLPTNSALLEGTDTQNHRSVNVHLPWSDNNIYWDCGDGRTGFDRINKAATKAMFSGRWNFWSFTKNAVTGRMAIYLNGSLFATDTGKHRPIVLSKLDLGTSLTSTVGYAGALSRFSIWNKALDSAAIQALMQFDIVPNSPATANLIAYYKLTESGTTFTDSSSFHAKSSFIGIPVRRVVHGEDLYTNFFSTNERPNLGFIQPADTAYVPVIHQAYSYDTLQNNAHSITHYRIVRNDSVAAIDTIYRYEADSTNTRSETGVNLSKTLVAAQDTVRILTLPYYQKWPQKFEIMSFVTPYGIGLDLGKSGKLWEFDATDYLPILHGMKRLSMERGSGQEEFDLRFLFVHGTPPHKVLDIQQIWPMTEEPYGNIASGLRYEPRTVQIPNASAFKLRSMVTGHGQEGEFVPRTHTITIDKKSFSWDVIKFCADNPLYPQGGTWIYTRSGWCPGAATLETENDITNVVHPGTASTFSYSIDMSNYQVGDSRYDPSHQLVSYGAPSFKLDAAIDQIERPSDHIQYGRMNPACDFPVIVLKNNGSTPLTTAVIDYYVDGGTHKTFQWHGSLNFLDTISVELPIDSLGFWGKTATGTFHAHVINANGQFDDYANDDYASSTFTQPPTYSGAIVINFKSNNFPFENAYEVRDISGHIVFARPDTGKPNVVYYDSLALPVGCYTLTLHDDPDSADGLSFWNNPNQGSGYLRLRQTSRTGKILTTLNPDFGLYSQYDFEIASTTVGVAESPNAFQLLSIYPNPTTDRLNVELEGYANKYVTFEIIDILGRSLMHQTLETPSSGSAHASFNTAGLAAGSYTLRTSTNDGVTSRQFIVK